jgi:hypothetical protein
VANGHDTIEFFKEPTMFRVQQRQTNSSWLRRWFLEICLLGFIAANLCNSLSVHAFNATDARVVGTFLKGTKWFSMALPEAKIVELAKIAEKTGGTEDVRKVLGRMNLSNEVLEDTFARILVVQGRVPSEEAEGWIRRLSGVPGFRSAMSKSMGASPAKTAGHFNEIRFADNAAQANIRVKDIGFLFNDSYKKGVTDIDIVLEKNGHLVAVEAKDYLSTTPIPLDSFRADMLSLAEFRRANPNSNVVPVFWITNKPSDPQVWKLLEAAAEQHKVELIVGSPSEAIHQIPLLLR